ncbi:MAG: Phospho-N-acetylmuramoyl-pentapeptide-transferase [candidate division WS2 bacterium]|uniref:Phospho-N-acetylmuramoyl-pentapeptide-transferase n=1 Tax=Psychracetigena formicireducens TaxID=2986056 RepID=A0A9E2F228_PSYF1|nr:Phospho-N-acetylmuramoyl-pentapeptide-transferase [Candidatus Psychracetigena formicireducens]
MLHYLFDWLNKIDFPGAGVFYFISFRSSMAVITSLIISLLIGKRIIKYLHKKQIGEEIRELGLEGQLQKKGTPTMGGLGLVGFIDDYIKVFKKNKEGLRGSLKIMGQVILGLIVGLTMYLHDDIVIREKATTQNGVPVIEIVEGNESGRLPQRILTWEEKSTKTSIPFLKNNEFDYAYLVKFMGESAQQWGWVIFVLAIIFIVTAVSNGANMTDGLDGLATGLSAIIGATLGVLAYLSGHIIYADYLNIMFIPGTGELVIFMSAFIGAAIGFLWYNSYPAQVFMGDTGSLAIGGIIGVYAILIRKELLIPILCGIFFVESLSVILQVGYFKYTKRKYGVGRRIFKMAPLHHHYQLNGHPEPKIVTRFWIIGLFLAVITLVTLKLR